MQRVAMVEETNESNKNDKMRPQHTIRFNSQEREDLRIVQEYCLKKHRDGRISYAVHEALFYMAKQIKDKRIE